MNFSTVEQLIRFLEEQPSDSVVVAHEHRDDATLYVVNKDDGSVYAAFQMWGSKLLFGSAWDATAGYRATILNNPWRRLVLDELLPKYMSMIELDGDDPYTDELVKKSTELIESDHTAFCDCSIAEHEHNAMRGGLGE